MKKFLFSRSHKKHFSDTVVRVGKNNLGFSLVELIVIIAIMAILAGIAIPVLGVFIEKAKKSNDMNLVSDIIYAIEIGNRSGSYLNESSFAIGEVSVPIGFIVLTQDGMKVIASATEITDEVEGECNFVTGTIQYAEEAKRNFRCDVNGQERLTYYKSETRQDVVFCLTHSEVYTLSENREFTSNWACQNGSGDGCSHQHGWVPSESFTITAGTYTIDTENADAIFGEYNGTGLCQKAYACQIGQYRDPVITEVNESSGSALYDALYDAFGDEIGSLSLNYDEWVSEAGVDHATIYTGIADVFSLIEGFGDMLIGAKRLAGVVGKEDLINEHLSANYDQTEDMLKAYTEYLATKFPPDADGNSEAWDLIWANAANGGIGYNYGLPESGKSHLDFIYGTAVAYNRGFSTYCTANGLPQQYVELIDDFKTPLGTSIQGLDGLEMIPRTVNYGAFNGETVGTGRTLQQRFIDAGDSDGTYFAKCRELYTSYVNSQSCKENGQAAYSMLITVNQTKDVAEAYNQLNGGNLFTYYDSYLQEISTLYNTAAEEAGDGIIIIVTAKNGVLEYQVSPAAADPRN